MYTTFGERFNNTTYKEDVLKTSYLQKKQKGIWKTITNHKPSMFRFVRRLHKSNEPETSVKRFDEVVKSNDIITVTKRTKGTRVPLVQDGDRCICFMPMERRVIFVLFRYLNDQYALLNLLKTIRLVV